MSNNNNNVPIDPNPLEYDESTAVDQNINNPSNTNINNNSNTPPKGAWDKYFDELDEEKLTQIKKLVKEKQFVIEGETFVRKKIRIKEFTELEILRAKFSKEKDPIQASIYLMEVYQKCAEYYLGISKEKYEEMDWEVTKLILDACNFRTIRGLPN